jgi:hypothetical protein
MVDMKTPQPTQVWSSNRTSYLTGVVAGDVTLPGIDNTGADRLIRVWHLAGATAADLTSEFSITANDTINNAGGTSSAGGMLAVEWYDGDYGTTIAE